MIQKSVFDLADEIADILLKAKHENKLAVYHLGRDSSEFEIVGKNFAFRFEVILSNQKKPVCIASKIAGLSVIWIDGESQLFGQMFDLLTSARVDCSGYGRDLDRAINALPRTVEILISSSSE